MKTTGGLRRVIRLRRQVAHQTVGKKIRDSHQFARAIRFGDAVKSHRGLRVATGAVEGTRETVPRHVDVNELRILADDALVASDCLAERHLLRGGISNLDCAKICAFRTAKNHERQQRACRVSRFKLCRERLRLGILGR